MFKNLICLILAFIVITPLVLASNGVTNSLESVNPLNHPYSDFIDNTSQNILIGSDASDIVYCDGQLMDFYQPRKVVYSKNPVVIYIHGGGWRYNDQRGESTQFNYLDGLRDKGFALASIDYHKIPIYGYPEQIEDVLCSVRYLRAHAENYNIAPEKIGVFGFSAGANLAAMVAVLDSQNRYLNGQYNNYSSRVYTAVTLAGLYDLTTELNAYSQDNVNVMMRGQDPSLASPITYVGFDDPSFLLLHGVSDNSVRLSQDRLFINRLNWFQVDIRQLLVYNADHGLNQVGAKNIYPTIQEVENQIQDQFINTLPPF